MALNFNKYAQDGEHFVSELAGRLRAPDDKARAGRVLRAVLHVFRNQISPTESMQMIAQLPMFIKALYVDGWRIAGQHKKIRKYEAFIEAVRSPEHGTMKSDFYSDGEAENAIYAVLGMIRDKVSSGEIDDILATLPKGLKDFLEKA